MSKYFKYLKAGVLIFVLVLTGLFIVDGHLFAANFERESCCTRMNQWPENAELVPGHRCDDPASGNTEVGCWTCKSGYSYSVETGNCEPDGVSGNYDGCCINIEYAQSTGRDAGGEINYIKNCPAGEACYICTPDRVRQGFGNGLHRCVTRIVAQNQWELDNAVCYIRCELQYGFGPCFYYNWYSFIGSNICFSDVCEYTCCNDSDCAAGESCINPGTPSAYCQDSTPSCSCSDWNYSYPNCGASPCGPNEKIAIRDCSPDGCDTEISCYYDASCETGEQDIDVDLVPLSRSIEAGLSTSYTVYISSIEGFVGNVTLSITNCPGGASCSLNDSTHYVEVGEAESAVLTVSNTSSLSSNTYSITVSGTGTGVEDSDTSYLEVNNTEPPPPACTQSSGYITRDYWTGISGTAVTNLTNRAEYPDSPSGSDTRDLFETPVNWGNYYGQHLYGFLEAPETGDYRFYISSDNASELWLSTDDNPSNKVKIAYETSYSGSRVWQTGNERSAFITLTGGQKYFIEAIHKEGPGDDNLSVGWTTPSDSNIEVVPGVCLSPLAALPTGTNSPTISISSPTEDQDFSNTSNLPLTYSASDSDGDLVRCGIHLDSGAEIPYPVAGGACPSTYLTYVHMPNFSSGRVLAIDFAENTGSTVYDRSGQGNNGTLFGSPSWVAGKYGRALNFDNTNDYIDFGNPSSMNFSGPITMAAWIKIDRIPGIWPDVMTIFGHGHSNSPDAEVFLRAYDGKYQVGAWNGTNYIAEYAIPSGDVGSWVFLVGVYDGSSWRLYRNGNQVASLVGPVGAVVVNNPWRIGASGFALDRFFDGVIDEAVVWSRALSASEILSLYNNTAFDGEHTMVATAYDTGGRTAQDTVDFNVNVSEPTISLSPTSMSFTADQGGPASPSSQILTITNTGATGSQLNWTATTNRSWCRVNGATQVTGGPLNKNASSNVSVSMLPTSSTGTLNCQISVNDSSASNNPQLVNITYTVTPSLEEIELFIDCEGKGSVTVDEGEVNKCNTTTEYEVGTEITLTAIAPSGRIFVGWSGDCAGRGECDLTMNSPKTVHAWFIVNPKYREF